MKNTYDISCIELERTICAFCPMGDDFYTAKIQVQIIPTQLFDFIQADKQIKALSGKSLIIEALVDAVFEIFEEYAPQHLKVTVQADSNAHFPVKVTKEK